MKKTIINKIFNKIVIFCLIIISVVISIKFSTNNLVSANENLYEINNNDDEITYSIFINDPAYSFVYDEKIYFIDNYDKKLKIYDLNNKEFFSNYLNLDEYGLIIDAVFCENYIFILTKIDNSFNILKVSLNIDDLNINKINQSENSKLKELLNLGYSKLFVDILDSNAYIVLTPENNKSTNPLIIITNTATNEIVNYVQIKFDKNFNLSIINSLNKILITESSDSNSFINLIFICQSGIYGTILSFNDFLVKNEINIIDTNFSRTLDSSNIDKSKYNDISIININLTSNNNQNYLFVSYRIESINGSVSSYTKIYKIDISFLGNASIFEEIYMFNTPLTNFLCVSNNSITYPSNQSLVYASLDYNAIEIINSFLTISNPNLKINYLEESEFLFVETNSETNLLSTPWNSTGLLIIPSGTDLIIIGNGSIEGQNTDLEDFKYCLYTFNNQNYMGYVKTENLTFKEKLPVDEKYNDCTIISNTAIYSLPTKVLGDKITDKLVAEIIGIITDESKVEILDLLHNFKSNNSIFLKVKVDDEIIGYIELSQVQNKNKINYFITNNASIKCDNTHIYSEASEDSEILFTLSKDMRIRVEGSRDKKTGFTKIEFCDEYGKIYTGFVLSDHISTDGWSIMQIIGAILIAVNIGILILVIYFRRKRITHTDNVQENEEINK